VVLFLRHDESNVRADTPVLFGDDCSGVCWCAIDDPPPVAVLTRGVGRIKLEIPGELERWEGGREEGGEEEEEEEVEGEGEDEKEEEEEEEE